MSTKSACISKTAPRSNNEPLVGGLTPLTTIDFPGCLAAVIFLQGCPWRCGYCHNPELIQRRSQNSLQWSDVLAFLRRRQGLLDGVVFSGGEPTLQKGLVSAVRSVKAMGFRVGLHTAGPYPARLARVLPLVDWIGMDVKAPFDRYQAITGVPGSGRKSWDSARMVIGSGVDCEFRTTVDATLLNDGQLPVLARSLAELGVNRYVLQECRPRTPAQRGSEIPGHLIASIEKLFERLSVRRTLVKSQVE